jgi:hypothetical protein
MACSSSPHIGFALLRIHLPLEQVTFELFKGVLSRTRKESMKLAIVLTAAVFAVTTAAAIAQNANDRPGLTAPQPDGSMTAPPSGSMGNPQGAPQATPQTSGANPGNTRSMDEQAGGNNQAIERNPDGSTTGSKENPSPR